MLLIVKVFLTSKVKFQVKKLVRQCLPGLQTDTPLFALGYKLPTKRNRIESPKRKPEPH